MKIDVLDHGFVRLVDHMGSDGAVVQAARVSYGAGTKTPSEDKKLIDYLMRHRHTSPFEMCEVLVHVKMPLFVARQWVRHRTASLNEYSARYSIVQDQFYVPEVKEVCEQSAANKQGRGEQVSSKTAEEFRAILRDVVRETYGDYKRFVDQGIARELARIVLPVTVYTEMYWKCDLNNIFHLLELRQDEHAQWEIRQYANALAAIVEQLFPMSFEAFENVRGGARLTKKQVKFVVSDRPAETREEDEALEIWERALGG